MSQSITAVDAVFNFLLLLDIESLEACKDGISYSADEEIKMIEQVIAMKINEQIAMASEPV